MAITNSEKLWSIDGLPIGGPTPNKEVEYLCTDIPRIIQANCPSRLSDHSITYSINSFGFRSKEFAKTQHHPVILALGCSISVGVGVKEEDRWSSLVEQHIPNAIVHNLARSGTSLDFSARSAYLFFNHILVPDVVMILSTSKYRGETIDHYGNPFPIIPGGKPYPEIYLSSDSYLDYLKSKNLAFIQTLCDVHGSTLIEVDFNDNEILEKNNIPPKARDGWHPGENFHKFIANKFIEEYNKIA